MTNKEIGIVILPSLFGPSFSHTWRKWQLERMGYRVAIIDYYDGHTQPFFWPYVKSTPAENLKNMHNLVASLDESEILRGCKTAVDELRRAGSKHIVLLGLGFGADIALRLMEQGIVTCSAYLWYPHVIFPKRDDPPTAPKEPDITKLALETRVVVFHGGKDQVVVEGNAEKIRDTFATQKNKELVMYPNAGHAWESQLVQKFWPNLLWFKPANIRAYYLSWGRVMRELANFSCNFGSHSDSK